VASLYRCVAEDEGVAEVDAEIPPCEQMHGRVDAMFAEVVEGGESVNDEGVMRFDIVEKVWTMAGWEMEVVLRLRISSSVWGESTSSNLTATGREFQRAR
jgi:hypothetical protein